jgi:hypothetical protein
MKITAISSFAHKGQHVEAGADIDVSDAEARLIVGTGRAKRSPDKPAAPVIETAEAAPVVERAEAPHAKKKK